MRNKSKITTLESKFPLLSVEQGCMVSKDADITVAFRVELPELFTVTSIEYEAMHSAWHKAIKVLPNYSIVHKQDWFIKEDYQGKLSDGGLSFLARSSERHFNERPYLHHSVYLFLSKTNKQRMAQQLFFPYISCKTMTCVTWIMILRPLVQHSFSVRTNIHLRLLWRANKSFINYFGTIQLDNSLYCYNHMNFFF